MPYAFDLRQVCGGYAYFSVFTRYSGSTKTRRYEMREPSLVDAERFEGAMRDLGQKFQSVKSDKDYQDWLLIQGWALVDKDFARRTIQQWLKQCECIESPFGSFTDITIASPKILGRSYSGRAKQQILDRDGRCCLRCGAVDNLTLQHIRPFSLSGETNSRNLVTLCFACNQALGTELDWELYRLGGLMHGVELSLLRNSHFDDAAFRRAGYLSSNLMHTRCEVW